MDFSTDYCSLHFFVGVLIRRWSEKNIRETKQEKQKLYVPVGLM